MSNSPVPAPPPVVNAETNIETDDARNGDPKIALVHDWLNQIGGAENVLEEMVALFPNAPLYTSIYAPDRMPPAYREWAIHTSFMQHLPGIAAHHQPYLPLYPLAFQQMDLRAYDLVLSNKSGFCHGVNTGNRGGERAGKHAIHVCYCLTPTRYLWLYDEYRKREQINRGAHLALQPLLSFLRRWDWAAAQRVDHFIAISRTVQQRIHDIYGRESEIIYPPVDTEYFTPDSASLQSNRSSSARDYYLIVSRLIPYKRIDLAVEAINQLPAEKLVIVGDGRDREMLTAAANANVTFLGRQSRERVRELMLGCKVFLFPGLEDFGIAPVEAMSMGRPVIAYGAGGALDTIVPGVTGELFPEQTVASLVAVLQAFDPGHYAPEACRAQAERFSAQTFRRKLTEFLRRILHLAHRDGSYPIT